MNKEHEIIRRQNLEAIQDLMARTLAHGTMISPRGMPILELINPTITINPRFPFQSFVARRYSVDYFKAEMRWKLGASKMDESIKEHAKMWESVQNPDGSFNSNYGQYWFGSQMGIWKVVMELIRDPHSRRAVIPMLRDDHLSPETTDTVCTESITFLIRDMKLHCIVHMRSSDQIFGLGTDMPTFAVLHMLVWALFKDNHTSGIQLGDLQITAASSHIYKRHWDMARAIIDEDLENVPYNVLPMPVSAAEAMSIIALRGQPKSNSLWPHAPLLNFIYGQDNVKA